MDEKLLNEVTNEAVSFAFERSERSDDDNAKYLINKIRYFRLRGVPYPFLYSLGAEIAICCTKYYLNNFKKLYKLFNCDVSFVAEALEFLADEDDKHAYVIASPVVQLMKEKRKEFVSDNLKELSGIDEFECLFYKSNFKNGSKMYCDGWAVFFRNYLRIIDNIIFSGSSQQLLSEMREILFYSQLRCPITSGILFYKGKYYDYIGKTESAENCYRAALKYVYKAKGAYGILAIYLELAKHYSKSDPELSHAFIKAAGKYNQEAAEINDIVLKFMNKGAGRDVDSQDHKAIIEKNNYNAGFSVPITLFAKAIKQTGRYKEYKSYVDEILA